MRSESVKINHRFSILKTDTGAYVQIRDWDSQKEQWAYYATYLDRDEAQAAINALQQQTEQR